MIPKFPRSTLAVLLYVSCNLATLITAQKCFKERDELKYAVDSCWEGGKGHESNYGTELENDANEEDCNKVKEEYGWPIGTWCVGEVTDMHFLFVDKTDFNEDISEWDTSSCEDFYEMFSYAKSFNGDLGKWDVSKVKKMYGMFNGCESFEGKGLENWQTSSLEDIQWMFYGDQKFNGDLSNWDTSKVTNMWEAFEGATNFDGDLSKWDTSSAIYMEVCMLSCMCTPRDVVYI